MKNTEPCHISLNTLIKQLKEGRFVIPDFQRDFKWNPWDIKDLMRSIFLDCHIGSFLLWKSKEGNFESLSCEKIYGFEGKTEQMSWDQGPGNPKHIILDGQQRLTALYYAFVAPDIPLPKRKKCAVYFIHVDKFMNKRYDEAFQYDWFSQQFSEIMNDREVQYKKHIFPLSMIGADNWDLSYWVQDYEEYWKKIAGKAKARQDRSEYESAKRHAKNVHEFRWHINSIVKKYQIAYIELDENLTIDKVCNIFTQTNNHGAQLDVFDFINALLKPKGLQLKHMWRKVWHEEGLKLLRIKEDKMKIYVLQVMSILLQNHCSPRCLYFLLPGQEKPTRDLEGEPKKEILIRDTNNFKEHWGTAVNAIKSATKMLESSWEFGGISYKYFPPYLSILPVFAALQVKCQRLPLYMQSEAEHKIKRWYWVSVLTDRYLGSVESTSARDFIDVTAWMESGNRKNSPALIKEFKDRFRSLDLRGKTKKETAVYNGIFNLIILQGAKDWMDNILLRQHEDLLNDHHIIPASWGRMYLNNSNSINTILNRTPLTENTNSLIKDRLPNKYLPELIEDKGKAQVRDILASHFISPEAQSILSRDPFTPDHYEEFITARRGTILEEIGDLIDQRKDYIF